jgi:hypothetical protein
MAYWGGRRLYGALCPGNLLPAEGGAVPVPPSRAGKCAHGSAS